MSVNANKSLLQQSAHVGKCKKSLLQQSAHVGNVRNPCYRKVHMSVM